MLGRLLGLFDHGSWFGTADQVLFPKLLALVCGAGVVALVHTVSRELSPSPWRAAGRTVAVGVLAAAVPSYAIWMSSGLENPLLALAAVGIAAVLARAVLRGTLDAPGVAVTCGLLASLAALTRPDGLVYAAAYPVVALVLLRRGGFSAAVRATAWSLVAFAVPFGAHLAWRLATFGHWLPNTAVAKSQGLPDAAALARPGAAPVGRGLADGGAGAGARSAPRCCGPVGVAEALLAAPGPARSSPSPPTVVLAPDWMGQLAVRDAGVAARGARRRRDGGRSGAAGADRAGAGRGRGRLLAAARAWSPACPGWPRSEKFRDGADRPDVCDRPGHGRLAERVRRHPRDPRRARSRPRTSAGRRWPSRYQVIDIVGLASAPIARFWRAGDIAGLRDYLLTDVRPEFVEIHGNWSTNTGLLADPRMAADYVPILMTGPQSGWFVRRDAVPDAARLDRVRAYARDVALPLRAFYGNAGRVGCGPIRAGATELADLSPAGAPSPR